MKKETLKVLSIGMVLGAVAFGVPALYVTYTNSRANALVRQELTQETEVLKGRVASLSNIIGGLEKSELDMQRVCNRALVSYIDAVFVNKDTFTKAEWLEERVAILPSDREADE